LKKKQANDFLYTLYSSFSLLDNKKSGTHLNPAKEKRKGPQAGGP
jgi:hypothetical protein